MQELMNLLSDQSRVIQSLQKTVEGLNVTIKSLNDEIVKLKTVVVNEDVGVGVSKNVQNVQRSTLSKAT